MTIVPHLVPSAPTCPGQDPSATLTLSSSILGFFFSGASGPWPLPGLWVLFFFSSFVALAFSLPFIGPFRPGQNQKRRSGQFGAEKVKQDVLG